MTTFRLSVSSQHRAAALFIAAVFLAPSATLRAQVPPPAPLPAGVSYVTSVEGINEYRLPNGLRVLLFADPTRANITVNITYLVGSRHEDYGETGMAHLLEHLLFKGSTHHPFVSKELKDHGTQFNGTTWWDRTNYFETFPASVENLAWALGLEADRMVNSFIAKKDLDTEMTVVRNEFERGENFPTWVLEKRTMAAGFDWHNYGKNTIGARSDIERVPIERLQAFYRHFYQPDNAVLVVAGMLDEGATLALVDRTFSPIPKPARALRKTYTAEPTQEGERSVTLRRVGDVQALMLMYHIPAGTHAEFPAVDLASRILGTTPGGRLHQALVETGLAVSTYCWPSPTREPGAMIASATVRKEKTLEHAVGPMIAAIEDLKQKPFTDEEVNRAKTEWLKQVDVMLNDSQRVALRLSEWQAMGDWRMLFLTRDRVKLATREQIQAAAEKYFIPANRTLGRFIPDAAPVRAEVPESPDLDAILKDYHGDPTIAKGEPFDPSPENIDRRVEHIDLPGGVRLSLLPKKTRGARVNAAIWIEFGSEAQLKGTREVANIVGDMLTRGTRQHSRQQIRDEFDRLRADMWIGGWTTGAWAGGQTTRENLAAVFGLMVEVLREPVFAENEFQQLIQESLARVEEQKSDPAALASLALRRRLDPYPSDDVRYSPTLDERIAELRGLTVAQVKAFHGRFYGASNAYVTVVGDFDPAAVRRQVSELLGAWRSPQPYARVARNFSATEPHLETIETPDKANAHWEAALKIRMNDLGADYPAMVLGSYILGAGFGSRLTTRIRDKEGLSYGIGARFTAPTEDEDARFTGNAICAPQNAPRVEQCFKEELAKALAEGFTAEEVANAKTSWLQRQKISRASDSDLVNKLGDRRFWKRTMTGYDADLESKVAKLTPAEIQAALRKHLDPAKLSIVRAGDFKKAGVTWAAAATAAGQ